MEQTANDNIKQAEVLQSIITQLTPLDKESKERILKTVSTFFSLGAVSSSNLPETNRSTIIAPSSTFSHHLDVSPKEFLSDKLPQSDVERVVCLAYYLNHYRGTPHFKTLDVSKLNTEAAQLKFSNAAYAVENAAKRGFLVPAGRSGMKQISAMGEKFVLALPDRDEAKVAISTHKLRRSTKKNGAKRRNNVESEGQDS